MSEDDLQLLTPDEVCSLLVVTKDWLYDQVQAHRVPVQRLPGSRMLRFRRADLALMLQGSYEPANPAPNVMHVVPDDDEVLEDIPLPRTLRHR